MIVMERSGEKENDVYMYVSIHMRNTYSHETRRTLAKHPILLQYRAFPPRCCAPGHAPRASSAGGGSALDVIVEAAYYVPRAGFFQVGGLEAVDLFFERSLIRKEISKEQSISEGDL